MEEICTIKEEFLVLVTVKVSHSFYWKSSWKLLNTEVDGGILYLKSSWVHPKQIFKLQTGQNYIL